MSVNASILKAFVWLAAQEETVPIVAYFPGRMELKPGSPLSSVQGVLQEAGIAYTDLTSCLLEVDPADRFMPHGHYAPQAHAAVARCMLPIVYEALREAAVRQVTTTAGSSPHLTSPALNKLMSN
jgi:hypothetical protein